MEVHGDISVLSALVRDAQASVCAEARTRILVGTPGALAGVSQAEMLRALHEAGVRPEHFSVGVGVSASAFNVAAFSACQAPLVRSVYEHLAGAPYEWGDRMRLNLLQAILAGEYFEGASLDQHAVRTSAMHVFIGISDLSGKLVLECARSTPHLLDALHASAAVPFMVSPRRVRDAYFVDGACAHPCPVGTVVRKARRGKPLDILVLGSRAHPRHGTWAEHLAFSAVVHAGMPFYSWGLKSSTLAMDSKVAAVARMAQKNRTRVRVCMVFPKPEDALSNPLFATREMVSAAGDAAHASMRALIARVS